MEKQKGTFRNNQIGILIFLFIFLGAGCALQADMVDLQKDIEDIKRGDPEVRKQLKDIDKSLKELRTSNLQKKVDIESKIDHLTSDIEMIRGRLDENEHRISEVLKKIDDQDYRAKDLNARMEILEGRSLKGSNTPFKDKGATPDDAKRFAAGRDPNHRKMGSERLDEKIGVNPSEVYNQAYNDYIRGNYDLAIMGFQNYIAQFPNTTQALDAHYWLGESFYGKEDYQKAVEAFEKLIKKYPKSEKVVSALLKEGYSYYELGNKASSRLFLKRVIDEFPLSEEAKLAKGKLSEIK